jgi:hypothetical protein
MTELQEFIAKLERLNVMEVAVEVINDTSRQFLDMNRDQLRKGKKSTGGGIGQYASMEYAHMKSSMNSEAGFGNVDLILTGSFNQKMELSASGDSFKIDSADEKSTSLQLWYGTDVFGLTDENQRGYNHNVFLPKFLQKIQQITGIVPN